MHYRSRRGPRDRQMCYDISNERNPVVTGPANSDPMSDRESRVLPFRRPGSLFARGPAPPPSPVEDLEKYQQSPEEADDFRHRMFVNGLALAATIVLIVAGIWIADTMAQMRKNQDCYLTGRPSCTPIPAPTQISRQER